MDRRYLVLIIRAVMGFLGGLALTYFFFTQKGEPFNWLLVIILAVLVVASAYLSEAWRLKSQNKGRGKS